MLGSMRSKAGGWVAKAFIVLLAASFAVWGVSDVFSGRQSDVLAEVGTRQISGTEFQNTFNRQLRVLSSQTGRQLTPDQARAIGLDRQVLGQLLRDAALEAEADKLGLAISGETVAQRIANDRRFQNSQGQFNADQFRRLLQSNGLTEQTFVASERQGLLRQSIANTLQQGVGVPRTLIDVAYKNRNEQRDARYFIVKGSPDDVADPSDSDLKTFYDSNKQLFAVPERRELAVLQISPESLSDRVTVSEEDLKAYYEQRKEDYGTPEKRTVQQISFSSDADAKAARDKIAGGTSFDDIAKERGLSATDINLGEVTLKTLPDKVLAEAAFALDLNEVSQPVKGKLSTALLRVTGITPGEQKTFDQVRAEIEKTLQVDRARDEVLNVHDKVEDARAGGQSLDEIAKSLSLGIVSTPALDRSGNTAEGEAFSGITDLGDIMGAAFDSDVGIENDALTTGQDGFTWFAVSNVIAASTKPLDDVRADAIKAWKARQLRSALLKRGEALVKRAEGGESLEALATEAGAEIKLQTGIKRNEASEAFDAAAVGALFAAPEDGYAVALEGDGQGFRLMKSSPVFAAPFDANSDEAKAIKQVLTNGLTDDLYAQYLADLQTELGVTVNQERLNYVSGRQQ